MESASCKYLSPDCDISAQFVAALSSGLPNALPPHSTTPTKNRYTQTVRSLIPFFLTALHLGAAIVPLPNPEFAQRRDKLRNNFSDAVLVLHGAKESEDLHYGFFQDTNFLYLSGWEEPGAILVLTPNPDKDDPAFAERSKLPREILFLPQRVPSQEKWTGRKLGPLDAGIEARTGFATVLPAERFEAELHRLLESYPNIRTTGTESIANLKQLAPGRNVTDASAGIAPLRMTKSEAEIAHIQHATDASVQAHLASWKAMKPGQYEYEISAVMEGSYLKAGCRRGAYAPIVGSGPNSTVLHYSRNSRRMDSGEVTVIDVAAECDNYASDITRTIPVGGKFTSRQREVYEVVLGAQNAAIAAIKPGVTIQELTKIARDYMNAHGKDLHGAPLGKYFVHGLGHHVGLDVHDLSNATFPMRPGMVITIEPGIYIPEENLGVRIEDMLLVTTTGSKLMSAALPRDPDELERALATAK